MSDLMVWFGRGRMESRLTGKHIPESRSRIRLNAGATYLMLAQH